MNIRQNLNVHSYEFQILTERSFLMIYPSRTELVLYLHNTVDFSKMYFYCFPNKVICAVTHSPFMFKGEVKKNCQYLRWLLLMPFFCVIGIKVFLA